jgi:lipoyl(octanoyl) transferase
MLHVTILHTMAYNDAWREQEAAHAHVVAGGDETLLFVEHTPVITFGRRAAESASHVIASHELLTHNGIEVVESDRGGDVTFHGPGQLVCYPIVRLADHRLSVGAYVKALEYSVINTLKDFNIAAHLEPHAIGVWVNHPDHPHAPAKKICALGVRIKAGVSMHGIALNVTTDLSYFDLIVPCGLAGRGVTSMQSLLKETCPSITSIQQSLTHHIQTALHTGGREVSISSGQSHVQVI